MFPCKNSVSAFCLVVAAISAQVSCSSSNEEVFEPCYVTTLDPADLCDPATVTFSLNSTNDYYPLVVGNISILEGEEDGDTIRIEREVLNETQVIDVDGVQVTTRVLEATEYINDALYEIARNFYVEAADGTVCYFGEDVEFYENGVVVNTNGTWRAGVDGALPGIIMPAVPAVGNAYFQEQAPGIAMDMGRITLIEASRDIGGTTYQNVVTVLDVNPLDSCAPADEEPKLYVPNIGEAADVDIELTSFTPGT